MSTTTNSLGGAASQSWVVFTEAPMGTSARDPTGAKHSICSTASFWKDTPCLDGSPTSQSEQSGVSNEVSPCGLPFQSTEEAANRTMTISPLPSSSDCLAKDLIARVSNSKHSNSQSETGFASCFKSWVTFDSDKEQPQPHGTPAPCYSKLDNSIYTSLQHFNRNFSHLPILNKTGQSTHIEVKLQNFTLVQNNTAYTNKNPFLHEAFSHIQPSLVNPFSVYFDGTTEVNGTPEYMSEMQRNSIDNPMCASSCSSTNSPTPSSQSKQELISIYAKFELPIEEGLTGGRCKTNHISPPTDKLDLDHLRNLKISDPDEPGCASLPDDSLKDKEGELEQLEGPYQPKHMTAQEGWPMLLRIPEKKNIMSSRHWGPIYVRISDEGLLQLFYEQCLDKPFRTLRLDPRQEVSDHRLQSYEETSQVHTLNLEFVQYREKRRIKSKSLVVHQPIREQIIKLGTTCHLNYLSFRHSLVELLRRLPTLDSGVILPGPITPIGSGFSEEELHVEVQDEFYGIVGEGEGRILKQLVTTRVHVLAFLSGSPRCRLGLNDIQVKGKEVISRHDIIPNTLTQWIHLRDCELHEDYADKLEFFSSRTVIFTPPSCQRFQLLRFNTVFAEKTLPFILRTVASVCGAEVTLQSWLLMSQGFLSNRDLLNIIPCENVSVRYPIPEIWAKNFQREGIMGEKSLKARFYRGASYGTSSTSESEPVMRVTIGKAKYEQAFKAVVWRISRLPDKNAAVCHPHTFFCRLELGSDQEVPKCLPHHLEVELDMPAASASKATVRLLSVGERSNVKKWISYKSHYFYQVPIEHKKDDTKDNSQSQDQPGDCVQQLHHYN